MDGAWHARCARARSVICTARARTRGCRGGGSALAFEADVVASLHGPANAFYWLPEATARCWNDNDDCLEASLLAVRGNVSEICVVAGTLG